MKFAKMQCERLETFSESNNSNLLKVKLWIMHDGKNKNKSKFDLEVINNAEPTIKNIPILAYIKRDSEGEAIDFDEHNTIIKITDDGMEIQYLERPIGIIPSDTEITYEELDGRTYLCVTGYIWKRYANEGLDLILESDEKGVSMEIEIHSGQKDKKDGYYNVTDYSFLGVTVLGDLIEPGMFDTKLEKYSSNKKYKSILGDIYKEIYLLRKEDAVMENENKITENQIEGNDPETFSLSTDNLRAAINTQLMARTIEREDYWGDKYQAREFWLETIIPDDNIVIVESSENYYLHYGIPYTLNGDNVILDFDNKVEYIQEWRVKNEGEIIDVFAREDMLKTIVLEHFGKKEMEVKSIKEELDIYKNEVDTLKEFKASKEKEELTYNVQEVIEEFSLEESEVKELKEKAINSEITIEQLKKECFCLVGMKALSNKDKFTKADTSNNNIVVSVIKTEDKPDMYGGLIKKHLG